MNPMLSDAQANMVQQLASIWKMSQAMQNPEQFLLSKLSETSNYGEILSLLKQNNGNFEKTVYDYAKAKGGDGDAFVKSLKQSMGLK